jgi:hypothetical protein
MLFTILLMVALPAVLAPRKLRQSVPEGPQSLITPLTVVFRLLLFAEGQEIEVGEKLRRYGRQRNHHQRR